MTITTPKRFTIAEYHRLAELGFFAENDRFELIKGEIVKMVAKGTPHSVCNTRLERELFKLVEERATVRGQEPIIILDDSEPEPDLVIARNRDDDYLSSHPSAVDILLLIEISDSTLSYSGLRCYEVHSEITKLISYSRYQYIWCTSLLRKTLYDQSVKLSKL